jgi:hypothetical protein
LFQLIFGAGLAAFTWGGLAIRPADQEDFFARPLEAVLIGIVFTLASFPGRWSMVPRLCMPLPTFLLYLAIFTGRVPPMPFLFAWFSAGASALFLTAYTAYLSSRSRRMRTQAN